MRIALAFEEKTLVQELYEFRDNIEKATGNTDWPDAEASIRKLKLKK